MVRVARIFTIAILSLVKCDVANSQSQLSKDNRTLCNEGEEVYFSCPLDNGATVSVCARDNTAPNRGYV